MKRLPFFLALIAATPLTANAWDISYPNGPDNCYDNFYAEADYLIWYANQEGMSYASRADITNSYPNTTLDQRDVFFKNKWDSGVRGAVGYKPKSRTWDSRCIYTYFSNSSRPKELNATLLYEGDGSQGTAIFPSYISVPISNPDPSSSTVIADNIYTLNPFWRLNFSALDLEFGRQFYLAQDAFIRPFFGLRGLWTNQTFNELITVNLISPSMDTETESLVFTERNKFSGFGARAGLDADYHLGYGLSLYGNVAAGIVWGWFNVKQKLSTKYISDEARDLITSETLRHSHHSSIFNFDVGIGLHWTHRLYCDRHLLTIKVGWEQHLFTDINQFQNFSSSQTGGYEESDTTTIDHNVQRGDLSLSGFIVGLNLTF